MPSDGYMKYHAELDHYQNLRAWKKHSLCSPHTAYDSLNAREKAWLRALNGKLQELEDQIYSIMLPKHKELQARVADPADWIKDFNLEYVITFYLREDDHEYEKDDDNILMVIDEIFIERQDVEQDCVNFAEPIECFPGELHCHLYHQLYAHCYLDWRDLLRIGALYVDIKIEEQSGMLPVTPIT
jgi:hypothetical protein